MRCCLPLLLWLASCSAGRAHWAGTLGNSERSSQTDVTFRATPPKLGATTAALGGKTHGSPCVSEEDDVLYLAWNASGPFVYAWRHTGAFDAAPLDVPPGADIISDSFDALLYSGSSVEGGLLYASVSSYNSSNEDASVHAVFHAANLSLAWSARQHFAADAAAFFSPDDDGAEPLLLTLLSGTKELRALSPLNGSTIKSASFFGVQCDWRSSLALAPLGPVPMAFVLCNDNTFGNNQVMGFYLGNMSLAFAVSYKTLNTYWPSGLVHWAPAGGLLGFAGKELWHLHAENGTQAWHVYLPPVYVSKVITYAVGSYVDSRATPQPILYVLVQAGDTNPTYNYVLSYNATGGVVAPPLLLGLRVDQFQGTMMLAPDGLTLVLNGWAPSQPSGGAPLGLTCVRLAPSQGESVAASWSVVWSSPLWTGINGRLALFAAPLSNGSVVVSGFEGVFQFA